MLLAAQIAFGETCSSSPSWGRHGLSMHLDAGFRLLCFSKCSARSRLSGFIGMQVSLIGQMTSKAANKTRGTAEYPKEHNRIVLFFLFFGD